MCAPICVFAFNRPLHLSQTLAALAANDLAEKSALVVFCDAPRNHNERCLTEAVRKTAHSAVGFRSLTVLERQKNLGLAPSIIAGVTKILKDNDRIIVVEDDLLTSPYFLRYMNDGLACYAENEHVASIHGYCFPHTREPKYTTFFLKGADCLGWGTWKRAWRHFNPDALALLAEIQQRGEVKSFNRGNSYDYTGLLQSASSGKISSWAVRWLASTWLKDMYTLYPRQSLIFHNGSDGSGTNCSNDSLHDVPLADNPIPVYPIKVYENSIMAAELNAFLQKMSGSSWALRKQWLKKHFPVLHTVLRNMRNFLRIVSNKK